jgi:hypothetical protein
LLMREGDRDGLVSFFILLGDGGETIPKNYFDNVNGPIKYRLVDYRQTNGMGAAFDIEVGIIWMLEIDDTSKFGIDYANHGTYTGNPSIEGVHVVGVIAIENFDELIDEGTVKYSENMNKYQKQKIIS